MKFKKTFFVVFAIILLSLVFSYFVKDAPEVKKDTGEILNDNFEYQNASLKAEEGVSYTIDFSYPIFSSEGIAQKKINTYIKDFAKSIVDENTKEFDDLIKDDSLKNSAVLEDLNVTAEYTISDFVDKKIVNIMYEVYVYSGGAHGITNVYYLVFDRQTGEKLSFSDVFESKRDALELLSQLSLSEIKRIDPDFLTYNQAEEGTSPKEENFQNFALDPAGFKLKFSDYQIGPYVAGRLEIVLPFESLAEVLIEKFR